MLLDLATRTLFAEFQETVRSRASIEAELATAKNYVRKRVKGNVYWYEQHYDDGTARQTYFGPSNEKNDEHVSAMKEKARAGRAALKKLMTIESRQAAMLRRSGLPVLDRRMAILLRRFSEIGLVHRSGVLVGTLAYGAYAGALGCVFERATLMTQDIDIARDDRIEIVSPVIDVRAIFSERGLECREIPTFSRKALPSSFISSDGIRIDFLVPLRGKVREVVRMPRVSGAGATALRFLDYLIDDPVEAFLVAPTGGISVTVPRPERYAIHKLIIAEYRAVTETAKKEKDLLQAGQLIEFLEKDRPKELKAAYRAATRLGNKWEKAIRTSLAHMGRRDAL